MEIKTKIRENYDCIVVGGGIAGISAAVSAAREGSSVMLIEKSINLGGLATNGLISWYEPLCDSCGNQMIFGIGEELIRLTAKYSFDTIPKCWGGSSDTGHRFTSRFSPTVFAAALDEYVTENGVKLMFDTYATYPVVEDGHCSGVICESVNGREFFGAKVVIDASGDASICQRAGMPTVLGENYMSYVAHYLNKEYIEEYDRDGGQHHKLRKWLWCGSDRLGDGQEDRKMIKADSAEVITEFVMDGKRNLINKIKNFDRNEFDVMTLPSMPQFRKIRRIVGAEDFNGIDGETFETSIGNCGDFREGGAGKHYQIPYGALYNPDFDNILACGRIISAPDDGDGWEVSRVIPVCALTGEAAGRAAAYAVHKSVSVQDVPVTAIAK